MGKMGMWVGYLINNGDGHTNVNLIQANLNICVGPCCYGLSPHQEFHLGH